MKLVMYSWDYPVFKYIVIFTVLGFIISFALYYFSKRYIWIATEFSYLATLILTFASVEIELLTFNMIFDGGTCAGLIAMTANLSLMSYNQTRSFIAYTICSCYIFGRLYTNDVPFFVYLKFVLFFCASFYLIYVFARFFHQREREKFKQSQQQKDLIRLFQNLLIHFHDGILITNNDRILFYNESLNNLFNLEGLNDISNN